MEKSDFCSQPKIRPRFTSPGAGKFHCSLAVGFFIEFLTLWQCASLVRSTLALSFIIFNPFDEGEADPNNRRSMGISVSVLVAA